MTTPAPKGASASDRAAPSRAARGPRKSWFVAILVASMALGSAGLSLVSTAAPVSLTVPYSATAVSDAHLDGDPATGAWSDALSTPIPLENAAAAPYGTATLYTKHNGADLFLRIDGYIDVPWTSASGTRFWLGFQASPTGTSHHGSGTWDGTFFGLWDGTDYAPQPSYPPPAIDTNGFDRPPAKDTRQDGLGTLRYAGATPPYAFTAEWRRPLASGDADDLSYVADGATTYNFFVTTDSDGSGSSGGSIGHRGMTNLNRLKLAPPGGANANPAVDLVAPDGGERWTGGTAHEIRWTMSDAEDPVPSLRVWINVSLDDGGSYGPIPGAQGISCPASPCSFSWTTPPVDSPSVRVRIAVLDAQGGSAADGSLGPLSLDATAPYVQGSAPADGAADVSPGATVEVAFSEPMDPATTQDAFSLRREDTGMYLGGGVSWAGSTMTFAPSASLPAGVGIAGQVNATARDASDPGLSIASPFAFRFTTADTVPPTIAGPAASPSPQEAGSPVNISAAVTDNGMVAEVRVEVRDPGDAVVGNFSMAWDAASGRYHASRDYRTTGTYAFRIAARDVAGNWNAVGGTFVVQDTTPPAIAHSPPGGAVVGVALRISADVSDNGAVAEVRLNYTDVHGAIGNVTMSLMGALYVYDVPAQDEPGTLAYFLWATDPDGNAARTGSFTVVVVPSDVSPPAISSIAVDPPSPEVSLAFTLTATVTDDADVRDVSVDLTGPSGAWIGNFSMGRVGLTSTYAWTGTSGDLGLHTLLVWARDSAGNVASSAGGFLVVDTTRPALGVPVAVPDPQEAGQPVRIEVAISDNVALASATVAIRDPAGSPVGNFTMVESSGMYAYTSTSRTPGVHAYDVWAVDTSGNVGTASAGFEIQDTIPPTVVATGGGTYWIGTTVTFDASNSTDNSAIANVTWAFQYDGSDVVLYGIDVSFTFNRTGAYGVLVSVLDEGGLVATDLLDVLVIADTAPPGSPTVTSVAAVAPGCLLVSWDPLPDPDLESYRVYRWNATGAAFDEVVELSGTATSYEDCGLETDRAYTYWVVAIDSSGNASPPSAMATGRTVAPTEQASDVLYPVALAALLVSASGILAVGIRRRRRP